MNTSPKSKWYWRLLRWSLIALAILVTLAAVAVTEENWRAKRDWENFKSAAAAKGDPIDRLPSPHQPNPGTTKTLPKSPPSSPASGARVWDAKRAGMEVRRHQRR